ncbi:MAG: serine/threonine-protein kinase [Meiothermus sp.]|nr:serine/threonine-protein kinase [Meiothermus sp.]
MDYRRLTRQNFKLDMLIGLGRSSQVYLAKAPDGTEVALKIPRREVRTDRVMAERFAQEVALSLTLNHPNLVRGLSGRPEGEGAFLALEYMEEGTLDDSLKKGQMSREVALDCLSQIASAVVFLHSQGIIHQDIKPANIFLDGLTYKLGDFGVAKTRENPKPTERAGSPFYMAPELFAGEQASPASDAYSFGVMAYEMLVGKRPFVGEDLDALAYAHLHKVLPPTNLPPHLDRVVRGMLNKDPATRLLIQAFQQALKPQSAPVPQNQPGAKSADKPRGLFGLFKKKA